MSDLVNEISNSLLCKSDKREGAPRTLEEKVYQIQPGCSDGLRALLCLPAEKKPARVLTLLHGAGEGPEIFWEHLDAAGLCSRGCALLLPELGESFCLDWGEGEKRRTALLEKLLPQLRRDYGLPAARERNLVGGISMGGFAAVSLALCKPERFCAAFSLSGALGLAKAARLMRVCSLSAPGDLREAAGRPEARLTERLADCERRPALFLAWGEGDWFAEENRAFAAEARALGYAVEARESPGLHDWAFWDQALPPALHWAAEV